MNGVYSWRRFSPSKKVNVVECWVEYTCVGCRESGRYVGKYYELTDNALSIFKAGLIFCTGANRS